jgi:hypothetical protein
MAATTHAAADAQLQLGDSLASLLTGSLAVCYVCLAMLLPTTAAR